MQKLKVIVARDELTGAPEKTIEIDSAGFSMLGPNNAHLGESASQQLVAFLGQAYGGKQFHLVVGGTMLEGCNVVQRGAGCTLLFMRTMPTPT